MPPKINPQESLSVGDNSNDHAVEWKHTADGQWQPVAQSSRSNTTETIGNTIIASDGSLSFHFDFPEAFDYVGLPAALFVSLRLSFDPVAGNGEHEVAFQQATDWDMTIDVGDLFSNANIQPQAITIYQNMAYLGCWLFGICQPAVTPRVNIKVSAFWNRGFNNVFQYDQFGASITEAVLDVQGLRDTPGVASVCKTCGHHPPASTVFTIRNARSNEPMVTRATSAPIDIPDPEKSVKSHLPDAPSSWLGSWVSL